VWVTSTIQPLPNQRAIVADDTYINDEHLGSVVNMYATMYRVHNIHFLASACMMEGNSPAQPKQATSLVAHVAPVVHQFKVPSGTCQRAVGDGSLCRWDAILAHPLPAPDLTYLTAMYHYARGAAYTAKHQPQQAAAERKALADFIQSLPADVIPDFNNSAKSAFELAVAAPTPESLKPQETAPKQSRTGRRPSPSSTPSPTTSRPIGTIPPANLSAAPCCAITSPPRPKRSSAANLQQNAGNGRSLFGLWQSLIQQHRDADAALVKHQFDRAWKQADIKLSSTRSSWFELAAPTCRAQLPAPSASHAQ